MLALSCDFELSCVQFHSKETNNFSVTKEEEKKEKKQT